MSEFLVNSLEIFVCFLLSFYPYACTVWHEVCPAALQEKKKKMCPFSAFAEVWALLYPEIVLNCSVAVQQPKNPMAGSLNMQLNAIISMVLWCFYSHFYCWGNCFIISSFGNARCFALITQSHNVKVVRGRLEDCDSWGFWLPGGSWKYVKILG